MTNVVHSGPAPAHSSAPVAAPKGPWDVALPTFMESCTPIAIAAVPDGPLEKTIEKLLQAAKAVHASEQQTFAAVAQLVVIHWDADMISELTLLELLPTGYTKAAYDTPVVHW